MRICYINPTFLVRRPISELVGRLDYESALFVPKKPFSKFEGKWHSDSNLSKCRIYTYSAINLPGNFEWPIPITPMFFVNLFRVFFHYDVVHMWAYFYLNSIFTLLFSLFSSSRLIMSSDTFPGYSFSSGKVIDFVFRLYCKLFGWFLFSVPDKIHLYGKSMVKFAKQAGVKKYVVIPTGVDVDKFSKAKGIDRKRLSLKKDDFVVVYAGLLVPRKGVDTMLDVMEKIDGKLLLVGGGVGKEYYEKIVKEKGLSEKVRFLGWRKDIPSILKSCDVLFLPSKGEGLPGIVMEGMACGLPVVASNIPCIPDLVEDGVNGFLGESVEGFVKGLKKVDKNMGKESLRKIKEFDWSRLIDKYKRLYNED